QRRPPAPKGGQGGTGPDTAGQRRQTGGQGGTGSDTAGERRQTGGQGGTGPDKSGERRQTGGQGGTGPDTAGQRRQTSRRWRPTDIALPRRPMTPPIKTPNAAEPAWKNALEMPNVWSTSR